MCFLASEACTWPGPGSSEVIRRISAWASVEIVTPSECVAPAGGSFQRSDTGRTLGIIDFLEGAHAYIAAFPLLPLRQVNA